MVGATEIRGVRSDEERESVRALLKSEFEVSPGVGAAFSGLYDNLLEFDPAVRLDYSRIALQSGNVVGHALLALRHIRIGGGDCPAGLVGLVVVHPEYRGQGIGSSLIEDIHTLAADLKLGFLVLAGDPAYYRRFGYHQTYVNTTCQVTIGPHPPGNPLRPAVASDVERLTTLSALTVPDGSVTPSIDRWSWLLKTGHPESLLCTNPAILGHSVDTGVTLIEPGGSGYARLVHGSGRAIVYEAGVSEGSAGKFLDGLRMSCHERDVSELTLRLPNSNPLVHVSGGEATSSEDREFQFRIVHLDAMLSTARDGMEERIRRVIPEWRGAVLIRMEQGSILLDRQTGSLRIGRESEQLELEMLTRLDMPEWGVGRMLLGQDDVVRASNRSGDNDVLIRVMRAICGDERPVFMLSDAI